ncbi:MAG: septum formation initiator family protein [bacterium]|nr:septum formation initiator family protein [bacterium]
MSKKQGNEKPSRLMRVVYPLTLALIAAGCVYALMPGFRELEDVRAQMANLRQTLTAKSLANEALSKEIESMDTAEGVERAARRYLRWARPDEVLVLFEPPSGETTTEFRLGERRP